MLQYATYSVISPEGCASILWKSADKAPEAAEIMGITADRLKTMNLIDSIITEPIGGAHRDYPAIMQSVKSVLQESLRKLQDHSIETLLEKRLDRLMTYGSFKEVKVE
jgi:acetyl-CoA carboxylase carboxyl transferase subunit alpha